MISDSASPAPMRSLLIVAQSIFHLAGENLHQLQLGGNGLGLNYFSILL
jgi:hypothetical protein